MEVKDQPIGAIEAVESSDTERENELENGCEELEDNDDHHAKKNSCPSHMFNTEISVWWRFGIPVFLTAALGLLLAADIGSGVSAEYILRRPNGEVFERRILLVVSIFSSVEELWQTGSYALAIFVVLTSVSWPFVKLFLSYYAWMVPFKNAPRRERLIEIVDAFDKWSFVDIFVLLIIMVAFRSTIQLGAGVTLDVVLIPKWGFYGFVGATIMSLLGSHVILFFHRRVVYKELASTEEEQPNESASSPKTVHSMAEIPSYAVVILLAACIILHIVGTILNIYEITVDQVGTVTAEGYSIISIGEHFPASALDSNNAGIRWMQAMYFFLAVALPLTNSILFGLLYLVPWSRRWREGIFLAAEINFAWSCIDVLTVSTLFSILQVPEFGNGLIDSGCDLCFVVGSRMLPAFAVPCVATVVNVGVNFWLYGKAHRVVYPHS